MSVLALAGKLGRQEDKRLMLARMVKVSEELARYAAEARKRIEQILEEEEDVEA